MQRYALSLEQRCTLPGILLELTFAISACTQVPPQVPNSEGTYQLVTRKLPDGKVQSLPDLMGLLTYTKAHRNFNVIWKDNTGKFFSSSLVSTYQLAATEYSETTLFSVLNDQIGGKKIHYDLSGPNRTVPVTIENGRIRFKLPFDPVTVTFEKDKLTAVSPAFTDYWEKVK